MMASEKLCRYCQSDTISDLTSPCNCVGTIEYVHEDCLITWLQSKAENTCELFLVFVFGFGLKNVLDI